MTNQITLADGFRDHAHVIDFLDPPALLDDLDSFGEMTGDAHIVAIGESAHYVQDLIATRTMSVESIEE